MKKSDIQLLGLLLLCSISFVGCEKNYDAWIVIQAVEREDSIGIDNMSVVYRSRGVFSDVEIYYQTTSDKNGYAKVFIDDIDDKNNFFIEANYNRTHPDQFDTKDSTSFKYASTGYYIALEDLNDTTIFPISRIPFPDVVGLY